MNLFDLKKSRSGLAATGNSVCSEEAIASTIDEVVAKLVGARRGGAGISQPVPRSDSDNKPQASRQVPTAPAATWIRNAKDGSEMVLVPGGPFLRGSKEGVGAADQRPQARVTLPSFYVDKYEITVAQYGQCVDVGICSAYQIDTHPQCTWRGEHTARRPITCVS